MAYGLTLDQVTRISCPPRMTTRWGALTVCAERPEYSLVRLELAPGLAQPMQFYPDGWRHLFVEAGDVLVRRIDENGETQAVIVRRGGTLRIRPFEVHGLSSRDLAEVYVFGSRGSRARSILTNTFDQAQRDAAELERHQPPDRGEPTTGRLDKYWGTIETIVSTDEVAGKRIFVKRGGQSSLEFHVEKVETYWVQSGLLKVGLRVGRAENHSIVLEAGESYDIFPGLMHMRIALADTVIIEGSTRDSDADSHLVEDGQTYRHADSFPST